MWCQIGQEKFTCFKNKSSCWQDKLYCNGFPIRQIIFLLKLPFLFPIRQIVLQWLFSH